MISNRFLVLISLFLALCACKTQTAIAPFVLRDSISITYKQGTEQPAPSQILCNPQRLAGDIEEQPTPTGVRGAAIESICVIEESEQKQPCQSGTLTSCEAHSTGKACALATRNKKGEAIAMAVNSPQGVRNPREISVESVRDIKIRVDTVFVERWHTQVLQPKGRSFSDSGPSGEAGLSAKRSQFYKNCTAGFFILLLLIFGRIALRITKAVYLRR